MADEVDYEAWKEYLEDFERRCKELNLEQLKGLIQGRREEYERTHESLELQKALMAERVLEARGKKS